MSFQYIPDEMFGPGLHALKKIVGPAAGRPCMFIGRSDKSTIVRTGYALLTHSSDSEQRYVVMDVEVSPSAPENVKAQVVGVHYLNEHGDTVGQPAGEPPLQAAFEREELCAASAFGSSFLSAIGMSNLDGHQKNEMSRNLCATARLVGHGWETRVCSLMYAVMGKVIGDNLGRPDSGMDTRLINAINDGMNIFHSRLSQMPGAAFQWDTETDTFVYGIEAIVQHMAPALAEAAGKNHIAKK